MHNVIPIILKIKNMKLMSQVHIYVCKCTRKCLRNTFPGEDAGLGRDNIRDSPVMFDFTHKKEFVYLSNEFYKHF